MATSNSDPTEVYYGNPGGTITVPAGDYTITFCDLDPDVNNDGFLTSRDAIALINIILSEPDAALSDVNADTACDIKDLVKLKYMHIGLGDIRLS